LGGALGGRFQKLKYDLAFRQLCAANVRLEFELPAEKQEEKPDVARMARNFQTEESLSVAA
jgi:hypothetical protein